MKKVMIQVELKPFEFQCKGCKLVHKRSLWSIVHYDTAHTFTCDCGHVTRDIQSLHDDKGNYND